MNYFLDTSVLISPHLGDYLNNKDTFFINKFIINDLSSFRNELSDRGLISRKILREFCNSFNGSFKLTLNSNEYTISVVSSNDTSKLQSFISFSQCFDCEFLVQDLGLASNLKLLGKKVRLVTSDLYKDTNDLDFIYTGRAYGLTDYNIDFPNWKVPIKDIDFYSDQDFKLKTQCYSNMYVVLTSTNFKQTLLGRVKDGFVIPIFQPDTMFGLTPKNVGQRFMIDALAASSTELPMCIFKGPAGTAKTLFALAAGINYTLIDQQYSNILVCRPAVPNGDSIGYLPGTEKEKLEPYTRALKDNLEIILRSLGKLRGSKNKQTTLNIIQTYFDDGLIDVESIIFQRGRSLNDTFIILDEMQNSTISQIKCLATRIGERSKIVVLGDTSYNQIDNNEVNVVNNGLRKLSTIMVGSDLCAQLSLTDEECVRSKITKDVLKRF